MWVKVKVTDSDLKMLETIITEATFFLSRFSFTNIHDSQNNTGRVRLSLQLLSTTSTGFTDILDIRQSIVTETLLLHIVRSLTQTGNLWFLSTNHKLLSYTGSNHWFLQKLEISRPDKWWKSLFSWHLTHNPVYTENQSSYWP